MMPIKLLAILILSICLGCSFVTANNSDRCSNEASNIDIPKQEISLKNLYTADDQLELAGLEAPQVTVIQFWGSWCHGCSSMMQKLEQLAAREDFSSVSFLAVSLDQKEKNALRYIRRAGLGKDSKVQFYIDPKQTLSSQLQVEAAPALCVLTSGAVPLRCNYGHATAYNLRNLTESIEKGLKCGSS